MERIEKMMTEEEFLSIAKEKFEEFKKKILNEKKINPVLSIYGLTEEEITKEKKCEKIVDYFPEIDIEKHKTFVNMGREAARDEIGVIAVFFSFESYLKVLDLEKENLEEFEKERVRSGRGLPDYPDTQEGICVAGMMINRKSILISAIKYDRTRKDQKFMEKIKENFSPMIYTEDAEVNILKYFLLVILMN